MKADKAAKRAELLFNSANSKTKEDLMSREEKIKERFFSQAEKMGKGEVYTTYTSAINRVNDKDFLMVISNNGNQEITIELPKTSIPIVLLCQNSFI